MKCYVQSLLFLLMFSTSMSFAEVFDPNVHITADVWREAMEDNKSLKKYLMNEFLFEDNVLHDGGSPWDTAI